MSIANTHFHQFLVLTLHRSKESEPALRSVLWSWTHQQWLMNPSCHLLFQLDNIISATRGQSKQIRRRQTNMWKSVRTSHQRSVDGSDPDVAVWQVFETRVWTETLVSGLCCDPIQEERAHLIQHIVPITEIGQRRACRVQMSKLSWAGSHKPEARVSLPARLLHFISLLLTSLCCNFLWYLVLDFRRKFPFSSWFIAWL